MKYFQFAIIGLLLIDTNAFAQIRGGRGGAAIGPRGGASFQQSAAVGPYGAGVSRGQSHAAIGPAGGINRGSAQSGSIATPRGGTINYGGASQSRTGPGGVSAGRSVGGVQVNTANGRTMTKVGQASGIQGPGGARIGQRSSTGIASGPGGTAFNHRQGGAAIGPQGNGFASGSRVGGVSTPFGTSIGGSRGSVAVGPHGAVANRSVGGMNVNPGGVAVGGYRTGAVATPRYGTYYNNAGFVRTQGAYVRQGFGHYNSFTPNWYGTHATAWRVPNWTARTAWGVAGWSTLNRFCSYPVTPIYYDYGSNIVYQDDRVYIDGNDVASAVDYSQQALQIANAGRAANPPADVSWQPLGVFALVKGDEQESQHIFQLAISPDGVIRGNYYNAVTDETEPLAGGVDKGTQRAAWTINNRKFPIFETGIANLTQDETSLLVHFDKDKTQQFALVRLQDENQEQK